MSFPRHAAYKDFGVAWLSATPAHWQPLRLRFAATLNPSKAELSMMPRETEVSFLPMEAIGEDGSLQLDRTRPLAEAENGYTYLRDGDVVIAKITPCFENGKGAVMRRLLGGVGFGTTELIVARPHTGATSSEYLHWLFVSEPFRKAGESHMYGAGGQKRVPDDFVRDFRIGFPPLEEQAAIAAFLDREIAKIDALVEEQKRLIELLKEKRQAVISQAVTKGLDPTVPMKDSGVEWLGQVPAHWSAMALKRCCGLLKDGTHLPPARVDDGVRLLSVRNLQDGRFGLLEDDSMISESSYADLCKAFVPRAADVLLAIVGATIGKTALVPNELGRFHIQRSLAIFRPLSILSPRWLNYVFQSSSFQSLLWQNVGFSAQPGIYLGTLSEVRIPLPSPEEQLVIADRLDGALMALDQLIDAADSAMKLLQERRSALISAAVTGKIDVRGLVPIQPEAAPA